MEVDVKVEFLLGEISVLQKHINLLKEVENANSITKAAENLGISYKNAWDMLDILNNKSDEPIIRRLSGSKKNSGSKLTEYGKKMIKIYDNILLTQRDFLAKTCSNLDIKSKDLENLSRFSLNLSARNQLNCEIVSVNSGAVNSEIMAKLNNNDILSASITLESEKNLDLKPGKRIIFIFKASSVVLSKDNNLNLSSKNQLNCKVISVKIGAVNAEIVMELENKQTVTSIITKEAAMDLKLGVNDKVKAIIKSNDIIIGV